MSKSGTLTYQMMYELRDIGFSTCVGIGGDPIIGTTHIDALAAFEADPETKAIVMIGEIGGDAEERAAAFIEQHVTKPVVGYVAGFTAPEGKTMGHAGAIISGSAGTAQAKKEALEKAGVRVGKTPSETAALVREIISAQGLSQSQTLWSLSAPRSAPVTVSGVGHQRHWDSAGLPRVAVLCVARVALPRRDVRGGRARGEDLRHALAGLARRCRRRG